MHPFEHELATTLLTGAWKADALRARLEQRYAGTRPWMNRLIDELVKSFALDGPSSIDELAIALEESYAFYDAIREQPLTRGYSTRVPEMRESRWRVPALATHKELASWLGLEIDALTVLADQRGISRASPDPRQRHYRYTWIPKRGGHRLLEAPKQRLRTVQRYILDDIVAHIPPHAAAHGFRAQHSIATFAAPHVGRDVVIRLDLQAFFTSVFQPRVAAIFESAGYPERVARTLSALCTHGTPADVLSASPSRAEAVLDPMVLPRLRMPHLPQGAPTSGALANLAAYGLDVRVAALANSLDATYTRYADDLVISGNRALARAAPTIIARVGAIAIEEGFTLNFRKTRVMTAATSQRITGLVVNDKLAVPRVEVERLRAILHNCARTGPAAQNREGHADFRAHLLGRVAWVASIDPPKGAQLRAIAERIVWP
jgi:RNA-directed DNA polymerase